MKTVCAVTVLYNPGSNLLANLDSYLSQVDKIILVDNTDNKNYSLLKKLSTHDEKIELIVNNENYGVGRAFNIGIQRAIESQYQYALLMDQDSSLQPNCVFELVNGISQDKRIFIASPTIIDVKNQFMAEHDQNEYYNKLTCISSGSLINLSLISDVGYHDEKLFIDMVDHELCLRARSKGYTIIEVRNAHMNHNLGSMEKRKFIGISFYPTHHSPVRRYYKMRNSLYIWNLYAFKYPRFVVPGILRFFRSIVEILLFENEKHMKLIMIFKGLKDWKRNVYGRIKFE